MAVAQSPDVIAVRQALHSGVGNDAVRSALDSSANEPLARDDEQGPGAALISALLTRDSGHEVEAGEAGGAPAEVLCAAIEKMRTSIRNRDGRGATGGLILLDIEGSGAFAFSTPHMARAGWSEGGEGWAAV